MPEQKNLRTYRMDIARGREPNAHLQIVEEMEKAGFVFTDDPKWPLPLKEPFSLDAQPAAGSGVVIYQQWED